MYEQQQNQQFFNPASSLDHMGIVNKTSYKKVKPDLKRHYPELWGRFLDNHYDPQVHRKPFTIAMKTPLSQYKYQQGVGLSYKFMDNKVLERLDVEKQAKDQFAFVRYEEFSQVKDGEVMVSIEHCINCYKHNTSTKHDEEKYKAFAQNLQGAIREQFPLIKVIIKPISTEQDQKVQRFKLEKSQGKPTIIDNQIKILRIGAFEVQVFKKEGGKFIEKIIHSKLRTGLWPSVSQLLQKVHFYLQRVPKLTVQLFKDLNIQGGEEHDDDVPNFKDFKVVIKSSYNNTASQMQLDNYLEISENHKIQEQIEMKNRRQQEQNRLTRPASAKSQMLLPQGMMLQSQYGHQNRNIQSLRSLPNMRTQSASTYYQNMQRSTDNTSAMTTINHVPRPRQSQVNDTYGIMQFSRRPISAITHDPQRARPQSAYSRKSLNQHSISKSQISYHDKIEGVSKKGRGLGLFGDDNDRIKGYNEKKETESRQVIKEQQGTTDQVGKVTYQSVQIGLYTIEVEGNEHFLSSSRDVNIVNDDERDELIVYIGMKPRVDKSIQFTILSSAATGQQKKLTSANHLNVKAFLLPRLSHGQFQDYEEDAVDEFEILWNQDKGLWVADLFNGNYLINVKAIGHQETSCYIEVRPGQHSFQIAVPQKSVFAAQVQIQTLDIHTGLPIENAFLQLLKSKSQQAEEGVTAKDGSITFNLRETCSLLVTTEKTGYASLSWKYEITQGLIDLTNKQISITIPMIKNDKASDESDHMAYLVLSYAGPKRNIALKCFYNGTEKCYDNEEYFSNSTLQVYIENGGDFDQFVINKDDPSLKGQRLVFSTHVYAEIGEPGLLNINPDSFDSSFKNSLQDLNLQLSTIFRQTQDGEQKVVLRQMDAPSFIPQGGNVWDICYFSFPYILEKNVMVSLEAAENDNKFKYVEIYSKLHVFLKNRKNMRLSEALGFDIDGQYHLDDTWLDPEIFEKAIQSSLLGGDDQKLLPGDLKKTLKKFELKKATQEEVDQIQKDLSSVYNQFTRSMTNIFGKVSLKRFNEFLQRL